MNSRIIELTYTWPAETFIQRHVRALRDAGVNVLLVARASADEQNASASLGRRDLQLLLASIMFICRTVHGKYSWNC